mmetsp:Transcript_5856/g.9232  ORF Transcript_5856/g.9232 Transcript_5856/m.9232 type:complete len:742 (+) Transcript_5856:186-2411(+)|eukprot:CAMPEP_0194209806 /NCGR_PEP_ID=MMETSP0156-20130528/7804_1 /TAXON_ID=33649 /ORGANISM="Thalassionema nitzschioides, Strain L26-B" /LENGTH=741 /DNA_ID=CAMNT_0038937035 /DNA_START=273 /DNA_END=2501 /DNA_ORIENTATION=-
MRFSQCAVVLVLTTLLSNNNSVDAFVRPQPPLSYVAYKTNLKYKILDPSKNEGRITTEAYDSSSSSTQMQAGSGIGFGAGDNLSNPNAGGPQKEYKSELVDRWEKEQASKGGGGGGFGSGASGVPGFGAPGSMPASGAGSSSSSPPPSGGFGSGAGGVPGFGAPGSMPASGSSSSSSSPGGFGSGAGGVPGFGAPGSMPPASGAGSSSSFSSPTAGTAPPFNPSSSGGGSGFGSTPGMSGGGMTSPPPMGGSSGAGFSSVPGGGSGFGSTPGMSGGGMSPPMGGGSTFTPPPPPPMSTNMPPPMSMGTTNMPPPMNTNMPPPQSMNNNDPNAQQQNQQQQNNAATPVYTQEPGSNGVDLDTTTTTADTLDIPVYNDFDDPAAMMMDDPYLDDIIVDDPRDDFDDRREGYEMELDERRGRRQQAAQQQDELDETRLLLEENRRLKEQLMRARREGVDDLPYEGRLVANTDAELLAYQREQEQSSPSYGIEMRRSRKRAQDVRREHDWDAKEALLEGNFALPGEKLIQGQTLLTWSFMSPAIQRVQCYLSTEGRPIDAQVELWDGPDNIPHKMSVYTESGYEHPFNAIIATPGGWNTLAVRNTGSMDFPLKGYCEAVDPREPTLGYIDPTDARTQGPQTVQGGALRSYTFDASVASIQILIKTQGRPIQCKIELIQGPNNNKQVIDLYTQNGRTYPFYAILETLGRGSVVRIINEAPVEFPITATAAPYKINFQNDDISPTIR